MTTPYLPGLIRVQYQISDEAGRVDESVFHALQINTPFITPTLTDLQSIQTAVNSTWNTGSNALSPLIATSYSFVGSIVTDQSSATGLQAGNAGFSPIPGADSSGPALARQVAAVISMAQAARYRGGKGRCYISGIGNNNLNSDGKTMPSAVATHLVNWLTQVNQALTVSGTPPTALVILRARTQVVPHTVPKTYVPPFTEPVAAITCSGVYGTQRRRIRKVAHT